MNLNTKLVYTDTLLLDTEQGRGPPFETEGREGTVREREREDVEHAP